MITCDPGASRITFDHRVSKSGRAPPPVSAIATSQALYATLQGQQGQRGAGAPSSSAHRVPERSHRPCVRALLASAVQTTVKSHCSLNILRAADLGKAKVCQAPWGYDSGASLSMRAKQSARRRSKTYILLLLTNLLHRSSARHIAVLHGSRCSGRVVGTNSPSGPR